MVAVQTSKHLCVAILPSAMIYDQKLVVFALQGYGSFALIQSPPHEIWARFFGSTMEDRPVHTPEDCFTTFPFPPSPRGISVLQAAGQAYYDARAELMQTTNQGLTATYNRFNDPEDQDPVIMHLRELHEAMDRTVLDAYGWTDLHPVAVHEHEWEAEEEGERPGPWRLRWPEADRDEVLTRLLELNRRRKEEEAQDEPPPSRPRGRRPRGPAPLAPQPLFENGAA